MTIADYDRYKADVMNITGGEKIHDVGEQLGIIYFTICLKRQNTQDGIRDIENAKQIINSILNNTYSPKMPSKFHKHFICYSGD